MTQFPTFTPATPLAPAEEYERAHLYIEARDYAEAARILTPVVEREPGHLAARLLLARAYFHSAQLGRAESELRRVLERDPVEAYAHLMLGRTLERAGRAAEAVPHLRLAAAMNGEEAPAPRRVLHTVATD
ncbi:tetratricopeptide repeat protein [Streptomyces sp. NPDC050617]|uniref:tetratricopeptide repeat protein n=1 Tax=Streptomyces sp. NPDC050617 TaxID=3154628 RepID=UPI003420E37F